jgi:hypothetical protein
MWVEIDKEVTWLHGRWMIYRQLYGTSEQRVKLLNESAGTFANILQNVLLHDVQLSLSKLGDPAGSGSRTNLTLEALREPLIAAGELQAAEKMREPLEAFAKACEKIRHRRNKWIAHYDRSTMLNQAAEPLMGPSREEVEAALLALRRTLNALSGHYADTTIAYEHFVMNADGHALLSSLRRGQRYQELVEEGRIPRDDYFHRFSREV